MHRHHALRRAKSVDHSVQPPISQTWVSSQEPIDRVMVDVIITARTNTTRLSNVTIVNRVHIEKQIVVSTLQKYHLTFGLYQLAIRRSQLCIYP
jgi:hypothetical protein